MFLPCSCALCCMTLVLGFLEVGVGLRLCLRRPLGHLRCSNGLLLLSASAACLCLDPCASGAVSLHSCVFLGLDYLGVAFGASCVELLGVWVALLLVRWLGCFWAHLRAVRLHMHGWIVCGLFCCGWCLVSGCPAHCSSPLQVFAPGDLSPVSRTLAG
jgi:hypothetical protein